MKIKVENIVVPDERARSRWNPEQLAYLKAGMEKYGQLSDISVRKIGEGKYELVDGESRLKQLIELGKTSVDCDVLDLNEKDACIVNILMNVARGEQDAMGMALMLSKSMEAGMEMEDLILATGHTAHWIKFMMTLNHLPEVYQNALRDGILKIGHVQHAARLPNQKEMDAALSWAVVSTPKVVEMHYYVEARLREFQISEAASKTVGVSIPPPAPDPSKLHRYSICLVCNEQVENEYMSYPRECNDCYTFSKYAVSQVGKGDEGMQKLFRALEMMESFEKDRRQFLLREEQAKVTQAPQQPTPVAETITEMEEDVISKPAHMSAVEWETLKTALLPKDED